MPLPAFVAGAPEDVRGTLVAVHFRDERGLAIFSLEQADGARVRALISGDHRLSHFKELRQVMLAQTFGDP